MNKTNLKINLGILAAKSLVDYNKSQEIYREIVMSISQKPIRHFLQRSDIRRITAKDLGISSSLWKNPIDYPIATLLAAANRTTTISYTIKGNQFRWNTKNIFIPVHNVCDYIIGAYYAQVVLAMCDKIAPDAKQHVTFEVSFKGTDLPPYFEERN